MIPDTEGGALHFRPLPTPKDCEVGVVLATIYTRARRLLRRRGFGASAADHHGRPRRGGVPDARRHQQRLSPAARSADDCELHDGLGHQLPVLGDLALRDRQPLALRNSRPLPTSGGSRARERRCTVTVAGTTEAPTAAAAAISATAK
jgi:hypothetical protein